MSNATLTVTVTTTVTTSYDPIVNLILPFAALGSALGALLTAYLNYRSRPILMRSVERHSDDLRSIAFKWAEQLPRAEAPQELSKLGVDQAVVQPRPVHIAVEDEFLFEDLGNHVPKGILLVDHWREYKDRLRRYYEKRYALLSDMTEEISNRTGLRIDPQFRHGLSTYTIRAVYNNFFAELTDQSRRWKEYIAKSDVTGQDDRAALTTEGEGLAAGNRSAMGAARDILLSMVSNIRGTIGQQKYFDWKTHAEKLLSEKQALDSDANRLLHEIRDFGSVPIVPGKCRYIKWATT